MKHSALLKGALPLLLVAVTILGYRYWTASAEAKKQQQTEANLKIVADALQQFKLHNYNYPTVDQGLKALYTAPNEARMWRGPYASVEQAKDAWGHDFAYETTENYGFKITSAGADGQLGSNDDLLSTNTP